MRWAAGEISQLRETFCPDPAKYIAFMTYIRNLVENISISGWYFLEKKTISAFAASVFIFGRAPPEEEFVSPFAPPAMFAFTRAGDSEIRQRC